MHDLEMKAQKRSSYGVDVQANTGCFATKKQVVAEIEMCYKTIDNFHKRMLIYTQRCIHFIFFEKNRKPIAEDVLQNVIEKIIKLRRKWNPEKFNFSDFLRMVIVSYLRNELKRVEENSDLPKVNKEDFEVQNFELCGTSRAEFDTDHLLNETFEELVGKCLNEMCGDKIAFSVFMELLENPSKNIIILEKLGLSVREVENAKKRIKNKILKLLIKT